MEAPDSVFRADVSDGARLVLIYLWRHARRERPTGWPSVVTIAGALNKHKRTVRKILRQLEDAGEIVRQGESVKGVTIWRLNVERHPTATTAQPATIAPPEQLPPGAEAPPGGRLSADASLEGSSKEAQDQIVETTIAPTFALQHPDKDMTVRERRRLAARRVWDAHEQRCIDRGIGRAAKGGGLRQPSTKDVNAIIRCAVQLRKQENLEERTAWVILRDAALAAVDRAADARDEGDDFADKLVMWRRRDPFGGRKLGAMLEELERSIQRREGGRTRAPEGANVRSDEERRELEERVRAQREQRLRVVGGTDGDT